MQTYWMTLIAVALLNGVAELLTSAGNLQKYVRLAGAFCLLCALVAPIGAWLSSGVSDDVDRLFSSMETETVDYDEIYCASIRDGSERSAEIFIQQRLIEEFHLSSDALEVQVQTVSKNDKLELEQVTLILKDRTMPVDPRALISYVNETWNCACTAVYD